MKSGLRLSCALLVLGAGCQAPPAYTDEQGEVIADSIYHASVEEGLGASIAILVDHSGSMSDEVDGRAKWDVARDALVEMLTATDSFAAARPDYPVNVGVYLFSGDVEEVVPMGRYDGQSVRTALAAVRLPDGPTAIGDALYRAREALYGAGTFRKYIIVLTDGENTSGADPALVGEEIWIRSEHGVPMYFVAFDVDAEHFSFVKRVGGDVLPATGAENLRVALNEIYRGRILAEDPAGVEPGPDSVNPPAPNPGGD